MRFFRISFACNLLFIPLLGHAQFFGPPPPSCGDQYAACLARVYRVQALGNASGLNINQVYISRMLGNCGKARVDCLVREDHNKKMAEEYERSLTPEQRAARDALLEEFRKKIRDILDQNKPTIIKENIDRKMAPDFDRIELRRLDEWLKQNPTQWWLEQERRRDALGKPCLLS